MIAVITKIIGFAAIKLNKPLAAVFIVLNIDTIFGPYVNMDPIEEIILPTKLILVRSAATNANTTNITFCAAGLKLDNQFTKLDNPLHIFVL